MEDEVEEMSQKFRENHSLNYFKIHKETGSEVTGMDIEVRCRDSFLRREITHKIPK